LKKEVVKRISELMDPFKLTRLDYKIQNISMFGSDESISPLNAYNLIELKNMEKLITIK
jgi:eco57I restriction endonuclease